MTDGMHTLFNGKACTHILNENKIVIKPFPFVHASMQNFIDDIQLEQIMTTFTNKIVTFKILYEAYHASSFGGSNTCGIFLTLDNKNSDALINDTLEKMTQQMLDLGLEFKCLIKFTLEFKEKV